MWSFNESTTWTVEFADDCEPIFCIPSFSVCCFQPIYMKSRLSRALLLTHLNYVLLALLLPTHLPKRGLATASHAQTQLSRLYSIIFSILENNNMTEKNFESSRLSKNVLSYIFAQGLLKKPQNNKVLFSLQKKILNILTSLCIFKLNQTNSFNLAELQFFLTPHRAMFSIRMPTFFFTSLDLFKIFSYACAY